MRITYSDGAVPLCPYCHSADLEVVVCSHDVWLGCPTCQVLTHWLGLEQLIGDLGSVLTSLPFGEG